MYLYLVFSYTGSYPSRLIRLSTGSKYAHVSISKYRDLSQMYSFGRKYLELPLPGTFVTEDVNKGLYQRDITDIAVYKIKVDKETIDKFDSYIEEFKGMKTHYDYKGAMGIHFNKNVFTENGYVCSTFVNEVLKQLDISKLDNWDIKPEDLLKLQNLEFVYEGKAVNYKQSLLTIQNEEVISCAL